MIWLRLRHMLDDLHNLGHYAARSNILDRRPIRMNTFESPRSNLTVAIIAGGLSRRMGQDKAPLLRD